MTDTPNPPPPDNVVPGDTFMRKSLIRQNTVAMNEAIERLVAMYKQFQAGGVPNAEWIPHLIALFPEPMRTKMLEGQSAKYASMLLDILGPLLQNDLEKALNSPAMAEAMRMPSFPSFPPDSPFVASMLNMMGGMAMRGVPMPPPPGPHIYSALRDSDDAADNGGHIDETIRASRMRSVIGRLFAAAPKMTLPDGTPDTSQAPAFECHVALRGLPGAIQGVLSTTPEGGLRLMTPTQIDDMEAPHSHPRAPRPQKTVLIEQFFDYEDVVTIAVQRDVKASPGSSLIS